MKEIDIYPACLKCQWQKLTEEEVIDIRHNLTVYVTRCDHVPVCKLIEGQTKFEYEKKATE